MYEFNGMRVLCDWMAFTLSSMDEYGCLEMFGLSSEEFKVMPHGARGYSRMLRHKSHEITVFAKGSENMGIHVEVKGSAVAYFLEVYGRTLMESTPFGAGYEVERWEDIGNIIRYLFRDILADGWFTRIDVSVDDVGCRYFYCDEVTELLKKELYVSNFRKWEVDMSYEKGGHGLGYTIYMGARKVSDMFLRVYDKKLEQQNKNGVDNLPDWVRWELELKDERADVFAKYIERGDNFGVVVMSILKNYVRFINRDNENVTRCSTLEKWEKFTNYVGRLRLVAVKSEKTVEKSKEWIRRQCMPTIAGLVMANGGSLDFVTNHLQEHYERLSPHDRQMYENYLMQDK